jgi:aspartyl-tRNA(Asn)/glutamyl-tRNA(Gln) amidotransferase subunit A
MEMLGACVEQVDPGIEDSLDISTGLWFIGAWSVYNALSPVQQASVDPDFKAEALLGEKMSLLDTHQLNLRRGLLGSHMRQFMQGYDLLVTPAVAVPALPAQAAGHSTMSPEVMLGWTPFSYPFNLTQQPACTIPCGLTQDGLPIGLQIVGKMFDDAMVLRAAKAYESIRPITRPSLKWA